MLETIFSIQLYCNKELCIEHFMGRHCRHVGGQKQYIFFPLGNNVYSCFIVSIKFAWSIFHISKALARHIINIPPLLGLYGENIGAPGLGSRDQGLPRTQLIRSITVKLFNTTFTSLPQKVILFTLSKIPLNSREREHPRNSYF